MMRLIPLSPVTIRYALGVAACAYALAGTFSLTGHALNLPGSLSRQQSTDLAAYALQGGKFPAGQVELSDAMLGQVVFPGVVRCQ